MTKKIAWEQRRDNMTNVNHTNSRGIANNVLPFYEQHGLNIEAILTDNGRGSPITIMKSIWS